MDIKQLSDTSTDSVQGSGVQIREGVLAVPGEFKLHFGGSLESVSIAWRIAGPAGAPVVVALRRRAVLVQLSYAPCAQPSRTPDRTYGPSASIGSWNKGPGLAFEYQ